MYRICIGCLLVLLTLSGCDSSAEEMDEMDNLVISDEETSEWSLPGDRAVASGELSVEEEVH